MVRKSSHRNRNE